MSAQDAQILRGEIACSSCGGPIAPNERRVVMAEGSDVQVGCMPCIEKSAAEAQAQGTAPTEPAPPEAPAQ